ncbi:MAG: nitrous oxide reductase accessory protein NosL [Bacteroidetes bacterium]|nr:nitrous oxide reductase accessory protein NosL [Bacteroidota bacterium]
MGNYSRYILLFGIISLLLPLFFPLWKIRLEAPQYPQGIGLQIYIDQIKGIEENDLTNINLLNHYIGMKKIEPESIPELRFMKYAVWGFIAMGFLVFLFKSKTMVFSWMAAVSLAGILALYDFHLWEYDFGNDIDPHAAIKMDGMNYQPPLFGKKQLLNITANSYPAIGGIGYLLAALSGVVSVVIIFSRINFRKRKAKVKVTESRHDLCRQKKENPFEYAACLISAKVRHIFLLSVIALFFAACSREPVPIEYGSDICHQCRMVISDKRYGTELITVKGKIYKFDSIECIAQFTGSGKVRKENVHSMLITDYTTPGHFIDAGNAVFLISDNLPSPMGANLTGFGNKLISGKFQSELQGELFTWEEILSMASIRNL